MGGVPYTAEQITFLAENITDCYFSDLTAKFNQHFGATRSIEAIKTYCNKHGLHSGCPRAKVGHTAWNGKILYTAEHIAFLAENIAGCYFSDLTEKFNQHFGTSLSREVIRNYANSHGLRSGCPTGKVGRMAWNKGKRGTGPTCKPIGAECISKGVIFVKTDKPRQWQAKHRQVWEAAYGPIPAGHAIIFADANKRNIALDNLTLVTKGQLWRMITNHLLQDDPNLTRSGVIVADIIIKCAERKRCSNPKNIKEEKTNEE